MTLEGLGEMFEGDLEYMCGKKFKKELEAGLPLPSIIVTAILKLIIWSCQTSQKNY
jgi:hypothetical protein